MDGTARPLFEPFPSGDCVIETYTVTHGSELAAARDDRGADLGIIIGLDSKGERFVANTECDYDAEGKVVAHDEPLRQLMEDDGWIGGRGTVTQDSTGRNIVTLVSPML
eukprot:COSAG04_NODE_586_length_12338_cov_16.547839_4_plen_109_part_00